MIDFLIMIQHVGSMLSAAAGFIPAGCGGGGITAGPISGKWPQSSIGITLTHGELLHRIFKKNLGRKDMENDT